MIENPKTKTANRRTMMLLVLVFVLPVILAKIALDTDFFETKATNNGILLEPTLDFSNVSQGAPEQQRKWRLVYALPKDCGQNCENALFGIQQVWLALGREMHRVMPLVLTTEKSDKAAIAKLTEQQSYHFIQTDNASVDALFQSHGNDNIYLVDTLDNVLLRYPLISDQQEAVLHSREILADLRKLLKLSRIG